MKKSVIRSIVGAVFMVFAGAAVVSAGTIVNSAHDFGTGAGTWTTDFQICQPCHTPHNSGVNELLWNHATSSETYQVYSSFALDAVIGTIDDTSKKCLSCHDGSVNIDAFGGAFGTGSGTSTIDTVNVSAWIGRGTGGGGTDDLRNDHPIGFSFSAVAVTDAEIFTLAAMAGGNIKDILTANDTMGCFTCHDVHNTDTPATGNNLKLLRQSNASSNLCLTCHDK